MTEKLQQIIERNGSQVMAMPSQPTLAQTERLTVENMTQIFQKRYGNVGVSFINHYNPDFFCAHQLTADDCYFGKYPTLAELVKQYDRKFPSSWLMFQLISLSEYCGCKEKISDYMLIQCADVIATDFYYLKVSELILFFHRFKSGNYGQFYGAVDPLIITTSLREFLKERISVIEKREMERQAKQREQWVHQKVSYEEYCMMTYGTKEIPFSHTQENAHGSPLETPEKIYRTALSIEAEKDREVKFSFRQAFAKKYGCSSQTYIANHEKD